MSPRLVFAPVAVLLFILVGLNPIAHAQTLYVITDLGQSSVVYGINNQEQVAGNTFVSANRAALWNRTSGVFPLGTVQHTVESIAYGLNDQGAAVGFLRTSASTDLGEAYVWQTGKVPVKLGNIPGYPGGAARAINNAGVSVGASGTNPDFRATLWSASGAVTDLGTLPGDTDSQAQAINTAGSVVGFSENRG